MNSYTSKELHRAIESVPSLWAATLKNESGFTLDFSKRKFLIDIYNDLSPHQVIMKPPQIGMTVCNTLKALWVAKKMRRQIIYTLPTQSDVTAMVSGSINRIIAQNPILLQWVKDHDTVEQKTVGDSIIFYRGTFSARQAMMVPSGLNIHDEVDASDPDVIAQYETRLQAQEDGGWQWYFSHPSRIGNGVDVYWKQSDQKEWFVTCPACGIADVLTWPDSISRKEAAYICKHCRGILSDKVRIHGEWRPTAQGKYSGYHVSQLMLYNKSAQHIIDAFEDPQKSEQYFYNYVLGLPYQGGDDSITKEQVLANVTDTVNSQEDRVIIGVDTGLPNYYVLMNKEGVFHHSQTDLPSATYDPYAVLEGFLKHWPRSVLVSDAKGDLTPIRELRGKYPGRVFLAYLTKIQKTTDVVRWGEKDKYGDVIIDRNRMLDLMIEWLKDGKRIQFQGTKDEWLPMAKHFENIWREEIKVEDKPNKDYAALYGTEKVWKARKPDHYVFALLFALVGFDKFGNMPEIVTQSNDEWWNTLKTGRIIA